MNELHDVESSSRLSPQRLSAFLHFGFLRRSSAQLKVSRKTRRLGSNKNQKAVVNKQAPPLFFSPSSLLVRPVLPCLIFGDVYLTHGEVGEYSNRQESTLNLFRAVYLNHGKMG